MELHVTRRPNLRRVAMAIRHEFREGVRFSLNAGQREVKMRYSGPTASESLSSRSGVLRDAVLREGPKVGRNATEIVGRVYIDTSGGRPKPPYARIQETGGIIRAKPGRWLAIPMNTVRGGTGGGRQGRGPRDYPGGFFIRSKTARGGEALYYVMSHGKGIIPLFKLVKQVKIPPRPVWAATRRTLRPVVRQRMKTALRRALSIARRG